MEIEVGVGGGVLMVEFEVGAGGDVLRGLSVMQFGLMGGSIRIVLKDVFCVDTRFI